jgi:putative integral membrane protein (TIGR02587 family)
MDARNENTVWMGLGRAIGGSIIFSVPMMMTMEMWRIGFYINPLRLLCLIALSLPLFYRISSMIGFRKSKTFLDNLIDVAVAYAVAFLTTGIVLLTFGIITLDMNPGSIFSMLLLQAVPGSLGALLARHIVGESSEAEEEQAEKHKNAYKDDLIILASGALFLAFNLAPTEEMMLISYKMTTAHILALLVLTLLIMHAFAVASSQYTAKQLQHIAIHWTLFVRITAIGYVLAIAISFFMLWAFESIDDVGFHNTLKATLVLGFPAGIGAAASRLIL